MVCIHLICSSNQYILYLLNSDKVTNSFSYNLQNLNPELDGLDYEDTVEQNITASSSNDQEQAPKRKFKTWQKFSYDFIDYQHSIVRDKYHALDKISQFVFPITFLVINIVYVGVVAYYRNIDDQSAEGFQKVTW